jgi:hypothetical protein
MILETKAFEATARRMLWRKYALWIFLIAAVYALICTPLLMWTTSDILLSDTILPTVLDLVISVLDFCFYWISFAYLFYGICRLGARRASGLIGIYMGASLFRYVVAQIMTYWILMESFAVSQILDLLTYLLLDALQIGAVLWITVKRDRRESLGGGLIKLIPIDHLFGRENPAAPTIMWIAAIPSAMHLLTRLIYDFSILGGLPSNLLDWIWVIVGYASEFLFAFIGYMVIVLLVNSIFLKEMQEKIETK